MPEKTTTYKFDYFKRGSLYSARSDLKRFVTLDYNMESFVGILDPGVISGWEMLDSNTDPLDVAITPGKGMVEGFLIESPYVVKKRSEISIPEREVEVIQSDITNGNESIEYLTEAEKTAYLAVISDYTTPMYTMDDEIPDHYIKVVTPYILTMSNNADNYIYISRPSSAKSYPVLTNYPSTPGEMPLVQNFDTYDEYLVEKENYDNQIEAIKNYKWRDDSENHFTVGEFESSTFLQPTQNKILIGKVVTRNNSVSSIEYDGVNKLKNLESLINKIAKRLIESHRHGGRNPLDPPHIQLETNRRRVIETGRLRNNIREYTLLSKNLTGMNENHQHTYYIDSNGDGYTVDVMGNYDIHFHYIRNFEVLENESTISENVNPHNHNIDRDGYGVWNVDSRFNVYVDNELYGHEGSVNHNASENKIFLEQVTPETYKEYRVDFNYSLRGEEYRYNFSGRYPNLLSFMMIMKSDFDLQWRAILTQNDTVEFNVTIEDLNDNPFAFAEETSTGIVIGGLDEFIIQSNVGEILLKEIGDIFVFTPSAAKNISVELIDMSVSTMKNPEIIVEILEGTEVQGVLNQNNILYVNAAKFIMGEIDIARIPFIDHIGRMDEDVLPFDQSFSSNNGFIYKVLPKILTDNLGHSHEINVNQNKSGITENTLVNNYPVRYMSNGNEDFLVDHRHAIVNGEVLDSGSVGLMDWRNSAFGENIESPQHSHDIISPKSGDSKHVYSIKEDGDGNVYAGTSNGFYIIPYENAYIFNVNGLEFNFLGNDDDLWDMLIKSKANYENKTGKILEVSESIYLDQIDKAKEKIIINNDSYLLDGAINSDGQIDKIMIKMFTALKVPNLYNVTQKYKPQLKSEDITLDVKLKIIPGESEEQPSRYFEVYDVANYFDSIPIWSIDLREGYSSIENGEIEEGATEFEVENIVIAGSSVVSMSNNLSDKIDNEWIRSNVPSGIGSIRKVYNDSDQNIWIVASGGLYISRSHQNGYSFQEVIVDSFSRNFFDIEEHDGKIFVGNSVGLYYTEDSGINWSLSFEVNGGCKSITKDVVSDEIYILSGNSLIYNSVDLSSWSLIAFQVDLIDDIFVFDEKLYVSTQNGCYVYNNDEWTKLLDDIIYTFGLSYDNSRMYVGCYNKIFKTDNGIDFELMYSFDGNPLVSYSENKIRNYFGYAYSNIDNSFYFKDFKYFPDNIVTSALTDFGIWNCERGSWDENSEIDIFVDEKMVYSTSRGIDQRGIDCDFFEIKPHLGILDFRVSSSLTNDVNIYDNYINVESSGGFSIGDRVLIESLQDYPPLLESSFHNTPLDSLGMNDLSMDDFERFRRRVKERGEEIKKIHDMRNVFTIQSISGNSIYFTEKFEKDINSPVIATKIPLVDGKTNIFVDIYESNLINSGRNTHNTIEDKLSIKSDTRPYLLNNTYLSNLLQLTQSLRYIDDSLGVDQKNNLYYDFRYSWDENDPLPYIGNYIDIINSEINSNPKFNSNFLRRNVSRVYKILVGRNVFSDHIFAATNLGVFWAKLTDGLVANWFYVTSIREPIYDLFIWGEDLYAATDEGYYTTKDMNEWEKETNVVSAYPTRNFALRWKGRETVTVDDHEVTIYNDNYDNPSTGYIEATSIQYNDLRRNRVINVKNVGVHDGSYYVNNIDGSIITLSEPFHNLTEPIVFDSAKIVMGAWWENFNEEEFTGDGQLKNTLLSGGVNRLAYRVGEEIWNESLVNNSSRQFICNKIITLSNGSCLSIVNSTNPISQGNDICSTTNIGSVWNKIYSFNRIEGNVKRSSINNNGNTVLEIDYGNNVFMDGIFQNRRIMIYESGRISNAESGDIIWNRYGNNNTIVVYGRKLNDFYESSNLSIQFIIEPERITDLIETKQSKILMSTNSGIYTDKKTISGNNYIFGNILGVGYEARINSIDISGTINSISKTLMDKVVISISTSSSIRRDQLVGHTVYIRGYGNYNIIKNSSKNFYGEFSIELDEEYNSAWLINVGRSVVINDNNSVVQVVFNDLVRTNQFAGGKMYVMSNENINRGDEYSIISNTRNSIVLGERIIPWVTHSTERNSLTTGQRVSIIDSSGKLKLTVDFERYVFENEFVSNHIDVNESMPFSFSINSNSNNILISNESLGKDELFFFYRGQQCSVKGIIMEKIPNFNNGRTNIDSDHYHDVDLIGSVIRGDVDSVTLDDNYATVNISNALNWDVKLDIDEKLMSGQFIRFIEPSTRKTIVRRIISLDDEKIIVNLSNVDEWDQSNYNIGKISQGWRWNFDASFYGYTDGIHYVDFVMKQVHLKENATKGENNIELVDVSDIEVNGKLLIVDQNGHKEIVYVDSINAPYEIILKDNLQRSFLVQDNSRVKVLTDDFGNNHVHAVKNNEIEIKSINDFLDAGYNLRHSHRIHPLIRRVSGIIEDDDEIIVYGSGDKLYSSTNLKEWEAIADISSSSSELINTNVDKGIVHDQNIIIALSNGYVFSSMYNNEIVDLEKPKIT